MSQPKSDQNRFEEERLERAQNSGLFGKLAIYGSMSGPGWVQSAVTLGGGSLIGALYLGVIGGTSLLWVLPMAILCGVILLASIAYVTLSTRERPFLTVGRFVSPSLAWLWLLATIVADVVFCAAQVALAVAVITEVIAPDLAGKTTAAWFIAPVLAVVAWGVAVGYRKGGRGARAVETVLKVLVMLVVICFFISTGLLIKSQGLVWAEVFVGFVPNFGSLFHLSPDLESAVAATGDAASYWRGMALGIQRDNVIAVFGSAVGINMTWLLPYTLLARGWGRKHREYSRFDLGLGLFLPFVLVSASLVLLAGILFHAESGDVIDDQGELVVSVESGIGKGFNAALAGRDEVIQAPASLADREVAAMLAKRDAPQLAATLEPLLGTFGSRWLFGIGVLAMTISTMIVHMMMNGFAVSEAVNQPNSRGAFSLGAALPALTAALMPVIFASEGAKTSMVITAATIATTLLPIAYLAFLLLMNSKRGLGDAAPRGRSRLIWNLLLWPSYGAATFACIWWLLSQDALIKFGGLGALFLLSIVAVLDFLRRQKGDKARPSLLG